MRGMPGVSGPLVDDEGFPRGDIDLYAVRQARNKSPARFIRRGCSMPAEGSWAPLGTSHPSFAAKI